MSRAGRVGVGVGAELPIGRAESALKTKQPRELGYFEQSRSPLASLAFVLPLRPRPPPELLAADEPAGPSRAPNCHPYRCYCRFIPSLSDSVCLCRNGRARIALPLVAHPPHCPRRLAHLGHQTQTQISLGKAVGPTFYSTRKQGNPSPGGAAYVHRSLISLS